MTPLWPVNARVSEIIVCNDVPDVQLLVFIKRYFCFYSLSTLIVKIKINLRNRTRRLWAGTYEFFVSADFKVDSLLKNSHILKKFDLKGWICEILLYCLLSREWSIVKQFLRNREIVFKIKQKKKMVIWKIGFKNRQVLRPL